MVRRKKNPWVIPVLIIVAMAVFIGAMNYQGFGTLMQPKILVIPVRGYITLYGVSGFLAGDVVSAEAVTQQIEAANRDASIRAIILEINSPGGTVVASEEISKAIEASEKPVVAWIREVGASGGYFIASSSDVIVADPASFTGSIGVIASYLQFSDLMEKYGVTYERLVSGEYKDIGSPFKELTPNEREVMQGRINTVNDMFIRHVSRTRDLPIEQVEAVATGEPMLGIEAYEIGLVDLLGSEKEAKQAAETLAGISNAKLVKIIPKQSLIEQFTKGFFPLSSYYVGRGIGDSLVEQQADFIIRA